MVINLTACACFFVVILILIMDFFRKDRVKNLDNWSFSFLSFFSLVGLFLEFITYFLFFKGFSRESNILLFLGRLIFVYYNIFMCFFIIYGISICFDMHKAKKLSKVLIAIYGLLSIIVLYLPYEYSNQASYLYPIGLATNFAYITGGIGIMTMLFMCIFRLGKLKSRKTIPIFIGIVLAIVSIIIQFNFHELLLLIPSHSIVILIMYFTMENPDVKVINQLLRNQELVEEQMEGKSRFLFEMSQDIKEPTNNILGVVNTYDELSSVEKEEAIKIIGDNANELLFKLNNVLNVSSMDASKIKIVNEEYNPKILLNGIKSMASNAIGEKQIKLNFEVSESLPNKLSGDDVRLKQIIMSVLYNCINHTEEGVINLNVDSIVRYDVARLMIKIEDTGIGMDLDTINKIIDDNQELNKMDIEKLDKLDVDLKVAIKIIKLLGGNFMIKSDKGRGTTFTIVLDQKCEMENLANSKELEKYTSDAFGKKRVLVVDDNKDELFKISDILGKKDININTSMIGKECVDRIRSGEIYNLIIIDDELKITSGYSVLKELNELDKFKVPVIIMLEKDKEHLKEHYIEDGFKDVILKENLTEELDRISNSYL